jgi:hypothetical protein
MDIQCPSAVSSLRIYMTIRIDNYRDSSSVSESMHFGGGTVEGK